MEKELRINDQIRVPRVRVIDENGQSLGIMNTRDALRLAEERGYDLVEVAPNANPPVCRLMDYGKYKYEKQKEEKLHKKQKATTVLKELRFHPNTGEHDFQFKARHARDFILDGHKVKAQVIFKGREILHTEFGEKILRKLIEFLSDVAKVEQDIRLEGNSMSVLFAPDRKKIQMLKEQEEKNKQFGGESSDAKSEEQSRSDEAI
ncbi:translation initiation factor IF-3 [Candidatus Kryptobacter tengchongensis]|uniref:translation initiation factor IF-3 n=1 Tax=Kryptobacter tengchongensis TaxID=1643429 RepID=UPI00092F5FCB|nr:translation initiation factor IF-3 [Candidatus Kryptobacter tengchongensis]